MTLCSMCVDCTENCPFLVVQEPKPRKQKKRNNNGIDLTRTHVFDVTENGKRIKFQTPFGRVCCIKTEKGVKIIKILRTKPKRKNVRVQQEPIFDEMSLDSEITEMEINDDDWERILDSLKKPASTIAPDESWKKDLLSLLRGEK